MKVEDGDQGRIIINHPEFNHSMVVPLDKWSNINAERVMEVVEGYQDLPIDHDLSLIIGDISVPKGSGRVASITRLHGEKSSIAIKHALLRVENTNNHLCLPTAIGRMFAKLCPIMSLDEWRSITKDDPPTFNVTEKVIKHIVMTGSYIRNIKTPSNNTYRKTMVLILCQTANVPTDIALSLACRHQAV